MNAKSPAGLTAAFDRLSTWRDYRLALLVAPSASGKTALLRSWSRRIEPPGMLEPGATRPAQIVWIDLQPKDNDPERFLAVLVSAMGAAGVQIAGLDQKRIPATRPEEGRTEVEAVMRFEIGMTLLTNALSRLQGELILVLDHYDNILAPVIHAAIAQLLDYLPPQVHLVIACREEPPLPLPRLRARRQMVDIRLVDLDK